MVAMQWVCVCVCVCVYEKGERRRERWGEREREEEREVGGGGGGVGARQGLSFPPEYARPNRGAVLPQATRRQGEGLEQVRPGTGLQGPLSHARAA